MRAVLFDLDGTLLDIDISAFLRVYFAALGPVIGELVGRTPEAAIEAVVESTSAMVRPHPGLTNREAFDCRFELLTGIDLGREHAVVDEFYSIVFPRLGEGLGPMPHARAAVRAAEDVGFLVGIATNPIFPAAAVSERIRWAGLGDVVFAVVTTYELMHWCKPEPEYFEEVAALLGVRPDECLMVGDDPELDMRASEAGMSTFYTGDGGGSGAQYVGTLRDLVELLPRLANSC